MDWSRSSPPQAAAILRQRRRWPRARRSGQWGRCNDVTCTEMTTMTTKRDRFARRQFLRGAGGAAIGLPFLLSKEGSTRAQVAAPPERLITVFFAQGIP